MHKPKTKLKAERVMVKYLPAGKNDVNIERSGLFYRPEPLF